MHLCLKQPLVAGSYLPTLYVNTCVHHYRLQKTKGQSPALVGLFSLVPIELSVVKDLQLSPSQIQND